MSHFLEIRVSKVDKVYNDKGKKKRGCSYDSIQGYIQGVFPQGKQGNLTHEEQYGREKKLSNLIKILSKPKYNKYIDAFNRLK